MTGGDAQQRRTVELQVVAIDPDFRDRTGKVVRAEVSVPADRIDPGPRSHRFHVVDWDATERVGAPPVVLSEPPGWVWQDQLAGRSDARLARDPSVRAQNVWAIAMRTLDHFEQALGRRIAWEFDAHHLYLVPAAFAEPNAYYAGEDHAVLFGYLPRSGRKAPVYTSLAHDVVAHEVTHAVLDGLRPGYLRPGLPDQAAFHEGFADIVALLSILSLEEVVDATLDAATRTDKAGRIAEEAVTREALQEGVLFGIAKQLGRTLSGDRSDALRRSATLPPSTEWLDDPAYAEPHRRGEILVAAVLHALLDMWLGRLPALTQAGRLDRSRAAEEGAKSAQHLLAMAIRAVDYTPPVELEFADYLDALCVSDQHLAPDDKHDYRGKLTAAFTAYGIAAPRTPIADLAKDPVALRYDKLNHDALAADEDEIYRFLWQNADALCLDMTYHLHVDRVRHATRVGPDGLVVREILADYVQALDGPLRDLRGLGIKVPRDVDLSTEVGVFGGGVLVFDQFGALRFHQRKPLQDWKRQSERLRYLVDHGLADTHQRFGFSLGERAGQRFSALHSPASRGGESW